MERLVVAHLIHGEAGRQLDRLRACYDPKTARAIGAHLTIAGPCNIANQGDAIAAHIEPVAASTASFPLTIAQIGTFFTSSATSFLEVRPHEQPCALHDQLLAQLGWNEAYPFHPHVTITEYLDPARTRAVASELEQLRPEITILVDSIALLQKEPTGIWTCLRTFPLNMG